MNKKGTIHMCLVIFDPYQLVIDVVNSIALPKFFIVFKQKVQIYD